MESCGLNKGLLITSEPYSEIIDPNNKNTDLLFGLFSDSGQPSGEAEIAECAGLSGQARIDCEARYKKK